jgi:hypothetical protein
MPIFSIDGVDYDLPSANSEAAAQLRALQFVNEAIVQRNNELQIALTAKAGYKAALKNELKKSLKQDA